jgi:Tfp pilus assembly protein PilN
MGKLWPYLTLILVVVLIGVCLIGNSKLKDQSNQIDTLQIQLSDQQIKMHKVVEAQTDTINLIDGVISNQQRLVKLLSQIEGT